MKKWWRQFICKHEDVTGEFRVSGHGYTEYAIWFCCDCEKLLWRQTREQH